MKITKEWGLKVGTVLLAALWLSLVAVSWADASEPEAPAGEPSRAPAMQSSSPAADDEYNFNWLDPEKKIYVLQNRRYLKAKRPMFTLMSGTGFSNPYRNTVNVDVRAAYYLSEAFGFEVFYTYTHNSKNGAFEALERTNGTLPVFREIKGQYGGMVHWVPWYAKINVFNKILYFDWYFAGGAGGVSADTYNITGAPAVVGQSFFAAYLGTGHLYHLTDRILVRIDFTSAIYSAQVSDLSGDSSLYSNHNIGFGLGLRF